MLKFIETKDEALDCLAELQSKAHFLKTFDLGLVGSFVRGSQKKSSKLDILLKSKTKTNPHIGSSRIVKEIKAYMKDNYTNKYTVLWYDLLSDEEEMLHRFSKEEGVELNPMSLFVNIAEEIAWVDNDISSDESEDELEDEDAQEGDEE